MVASYWSSKRVLNFDGKLMFQGLKPFRRIFTYTFGALGHTFRVEESSKVIELYVDESPFRAMTMKAALPQFLEPEVNREPEWTPPLIKERRSRLDQILSLMLQPDFLEIDAPMPKSKRPPQKKVAENFSELEVYTDRLQFASTETRQRFVNASTFNRGRSPVHKQPELKADQTWKAARRHRNSSVPSQSVDLLGFDTELTTIRHARAASPVPRAEHEVKALPTPLQRSLLTKEFSDGYKHFSIVPRHARRSSMPSTDSFNTTPNDLFNTTSDIFAKPAFSPKATTRTKLDFEATFSTIY
jgi:hypothetical protein